MKNLFDEDEMIKLCQELGIELVDSETKEPQLNGKDLNAENINEIIKETGYALTK